MEKNDIENKNIKGIKQKEAEVAKRQKQHDQRVRIDGLLRLYQDAIALEKAITDKSWGTTVKLRVINILSDMVNIVERKDWFSVHLHDAFPDVDIRMLAYGCHISFDCPFLNAVLKKINMSHSDYNGYKIRSGSMIDMEHRRKMGKRK